MSTLEAVVRMSMTVRWVVLCVIILPLIAVLAIPLIVWGWGFHWVDLGLLLGMYLLTGMGITVGFHRLFTHRSFETSVPVKFVLGVLGSMTAQGSLLEWVALHRRHHQFSDDEGDPHSPHGNNEGVRGVFRRFWHAHVGWIVRPGEFGLDRYVTDLRQSRALRIVDATFAVWVGLGLLIPAAVGGLVTGSWAGVLTGLIWGGPVRIFLVHHITWSVNSACHLWGSQPFQTNDESRDNALFGLLAWGEGWHNSHHAFPTSARHGLAWWQLDLSYVVIWVLTRLGLVWNVKLPSREAQVRRRRAAA
ncbi:acyl-CoA desaturase [Tautonia rosea]|uniref:acyl-CoA desaturase n=1 Tax=Tautonia rosea TaxID=2728037 RepID=UPI0019D271B9|nr:acyl-CoA desaturase [Tautonia rosea]